jgi:hypothetical protein
MENKMETKEAIGIWVAIVWEDSPEGYEQCYISFSDDPYENDTPIVCDDGVFYYFTEDEKKDLAKAIADRRERFATEGNDWYIDLSLDYEYDFI